MSKQELIALPYEKWTQIKRFGLYYERKGNGILEQDVGKLLLKWLEKAAVKLKEDSPEKYDAMMKASEPFKCGDRVFKMRLVDHLPFTNATINYNEGSLNNDKDAIKPHFDGKDYENGLSVTESFKLGDVSYGRLVVEHSNTFNHVEVGNMAIGSLHNLKHWVEPVEGLGFRGSFITQIYGPNIELKEALTKEANPYIVSQNEKVQNVYDGLVLMNEREWEMVQKGTVTANYNLESLKLALDIDKNYVLFLPKLLKRMQSKMGQKRKHDLF